MNLPLLLLMPAVYIMKEYCFQPKDAGTCQEYTSRYYYNSETGICEEFNYGGCKGNKNNFLTEKSCQLICIEGSINRPVECKLPLALGNCPLSLVRYYFNLTSEKCEQFIYTGCNGNLNNFFSLEKCKSQCLNVRPSNLNEAMCSSNPDPGPCMAEIERFYYSSKTGKCYPFTYGGCGGNTNNYNSKESCLR
ncbi:TFPI2 [Acanthosepion pharaonis]|uniref:TFPI2 n=1 Tax=Acanthosepion pharaonis TaxID=158019 RepID=A0A812E3D0_ACAPH|nr:TFPI2 [Sepia pharaonis]